MPMRFHNRLSKSQKLTNLWQRGHLNLNGSLCANTRLRNGSATRNSAFGRIGDRNAWKDPATGWHAECIRKAHMHTNITLPTTGTLRKSVSRIYCRFSRLKSGILTVLWQFTKVLVRNISLCLATIMTTSTSGTANTNRGIL